MNFKLSQLSYLLLSILVVSVPAQAAIFGQNANINIESKLAGSSTYLAKIPKNQEEEFVRVITEHNSEVKQLSREIKAIRVNFRISNAQKREILPQFRPRIQGIFSKYNGRISAFNLTAAEKKLLADLAKLDEKGMYELLNCPDNGATMCI
jgi:hypothetical protein